MQPREKIIIEASGKPGDHGFQYFGQRDGVGKFENYFICVQAKLPII